MRMIALAVLAFALPAMAEFSVVEETETTTVYRDGNQFIFLTDARGRASIREIARARGPENIAASSFRSQLSGKDMFYLFFVRTRMQDGMAVCEKFATRAKNQSEREVQLQVLALAPCG